MIIKLRHIILTLIVLLLPISINAKQDARTIAISHDKPFILIMASYPLDNNYIAQVMSGFYQKFEDLGNIAQIRLETIQCTSLSDMYRWESRFENIVKSYVNDGNIPDLIILLGQETWSSYISSKDPIIRNIPVMPGLCTRNFTLIPSEVEDWSTWTPQSHDVMELSPDYKVVGGILRAPNFTNNLDLLYRFYPNRNNLVFITDNTYGGVTLLSYCQAEAERSLRDHERKFTIIDGRVCSIREAVAKISEMPDSLTAIIVGTWKVDYTNRYYESSSLDVIAEKFPNIPLVTTLGHSMNMCLGGFTPHYDNFHEGNVLAQHATDFLSGKEMGKDKIEFVKNEYKVNYNKLQDIPDFESKIPSGAIVLGKNPPIWEAYKSEIATVGLIIIVLTCLVAVLVYLYSRAVRLQNELKFREAELYSAKIHAENSNKMKSAFLANMSHEIRTPLNAIVGFSEVLTMNEDMPIEEKKQLVSIINNNSNLLLNLINGILDLSRLEAGKTKYEIDNVELVSICHTALLSAKSAFRKNLDYKFKSCADKINVFVDAQRIQQVVLNLLSNAAKFTDKGSVTLGIELKEEKREVHVSIADTGVGVPEDQYEKVFERFEKLNEFTQGTGIGLSMCKTIVEHFGGKIWVDPTYHGGAKFVFSLPLLSDLMENKSVEVATGESNI
ncbi:MAG: HAMP domain-containing sensor histidine kinase [Bacteroidia bacterium]|nr:HAMP domain-containing sensor histidine kinase [Bacteroidia bacterium]